MNQQDLTLQVNLSAGDAAYAALTVPALVRGHGRVTRRLAVVDCCRPQRTRIFDPATRVPEAGFQRRLAQIRDLAEDFRKSGLFDEIAYLEPEDARFRLFARKYTRPWMTETHDYGGCAYMGYWGALELPRTRFVLHYDADMLLHQDPGFSWPDEALALWPSQPPGDLGEPPHQPARICGLAGGRRALLP